MWARNSRCAMADEPERLDDHQRGDEMRENRGAPWLGPAQHAEHRADGHSREIENEPWSVAPLVNQILDARHRLLAEHAAVTLEPGQKRHDLVQLTQSKPRKSAEQKEISQRAGKGFGITTNGNPSGERNAERESAERRKCHTGVELQLVSPPAAIESHHVDEIENEA